MTIAIIIAIIVSVILGHEIGHVIVARHCGWKLGGIFLGKWWLGAAGFKYIPRDWTDIWKVALGGLAATEIMAVGWWLTLPGSYAMMGFYLNTCVLLFNMLPISVVDGGQVLVGLRMERAR